MPDPYTYFIPISLEWDLQKATRNVRKHGVAFEEAATCLMDPKALTTEDPDSVDEMRWRLVGMSTSGRLLTLVYTTRGQDRVRLISARKSTRQEAAAYEG